MNSRSSSHSTTLQDSPLLLAPANETKCGTLTVLERREGRGREVVVRREGVESSLGWFPDPSYRVAAGVRVDRGKLVIFTTVEFEDTLVVWDLSSPSPR